MTPHNLSTLARRRQIVANESWLIEDIFPAGHLHMLVGGSGSGKTTWLFQMLHAWSQGQPILNKASHPQPWAYVSLDRGMLDTTQTLRRIGLENWDCPVFTFSDLVNLSQGVSISNVLDHPWFTGIKFFVIEGLQMLLPDTKAGQSQNKVEGLWAAQLRAQYLDRGYTILAVTHRPKKSGTGADKLSHRSDALGSVSLMGAAGTIIKIEEAPKGAKAVTDPETGDDEADQRVVTWDCRQYKRVSALYDIDNHGRFTNESIGASPEALIEAQVDVLARSNQYDLWLLTQPDTFQGMETKHIEDSLMSQFGCSRATVHRWLKSAVKRGLLTKFDMGKFRKKLSSNLPS